MSFSNKPNGRDYVIRSNSNPNKVQNYRNTSTNAQYNNGEGYCYEEKSQHSCQSPKIVTDNYGVPPHNSCQRDPYPYKNNTNRSKPYYKNYNDKQYNNYSIQRPDSPDDVAIPEIDHLRDFVKEQTERFKNELSRHEVQKSNSPSASNHQYNDQNNYRYKTYASLGRTGNGLPVSHSLGSLVNSNMNIAPVDTSTVSPSCSDNSNRHPDARITQGQFSAKNNNGYNYNKQHTVPSSGKPSPGLTRNPSHEDSFSKAPPVNKNRNDSPNNTVDKSANNKTQYPSPTGSSGSRQDPKKAFIRSKQYTFVNGSNPAMHQLNQNNSVTAHSVAVEMRKSDQQQQPRPTMSAVVRNGFANGAAKAPTRKTRLDGETEPQSQRAVVSVADTTRHLSHSGSTTDSQDVVDTPTVPEQFFTPDPPASPCSTGSSPDPAQMRVAFSSPRDSRKTPKPVSSE